MKKGIILMMLFVSMTITAMAEGTITVKSVSQRWPWNGQIDVTYDITLPDDNNNYDVTFQVTLGETTYEVTPDFYTCATGNNAAIINLLNIGGFKKDMVGSATVKATLVNKGQKNDEEEKANLIDYFDGLGTDYASILSDYNNNKGAYDTLQLIDKYSYVEYSEEAGPVWHIRLNTEDSEVDYTGNQLEEEFYGKPLSNYLQYIRATSQKLYDFFLEHFGTSFIVSLSTYPNVIDEIKKCRGDESKAFAPSVAKTKYISIIPEAKYYGVYNLTGFWMLSDVSSWADIKSMMTKTALSTGENNIEICKCVLNSDILFKVQAKMIEAAQQDRQVNNILRGYDSYYKDVKKALRLEELSKEN